MMPVAKKAAKKKVVVPRGIHLKKSSKGFSVHIHAANGNKLAVMTGYNNRPNALKGVKALYGALAKAGDAIAFLFMDHTSMASSHLKKAPKK